MAAPIKNQLERTGNFKGLAAAIGLLFVIFTVLFYASGLPEKTSTVVANLQQDTSQVAGQNTDEEYVPVSDVSDSQSPAQDTDQSYYLVTSVTDGDTIKVSVNGNTETVRLIGVDTPETKDPRKPVQCFGVEASSFAKKTLQNKSVRLEPDNSQQNRDKYGRLLRYVYLQDGTLFNLMLIESGYAYEYTYKVPYDLGADFKAAAYEAQTNQVGLWNPATCNGHKS